MSESSAETTLRDAGMLPAEAVTSEELAWEEVDRMFSGRPEPVKFEEIGQTVIGHVTGAYTRQRTKFGTNEPEFWDDGSPKLEPVIELMTDEGLRSLYVSSWRMRNALQLAFYAVGVRGPRPGGKLVVRLAGHEATKVPGGSPAKVYEAAYDPPGRKTLDQQLAGKPQAAALGLAVGSDDQPPF